MSANGAPQPQHQPPEGQGQAEGQVPMHSVGQATKEVFTGTPAALGRLGKEMWEGLKKPAPGAALGGVIGLAAATTFGVVPTLAAGLLGYVAYRAFRRRREEGAAT